MQPQYPQQFPQQPAYPPVPTAYPPQFPQQPAYPAQQQVAAYPPQQYPPQPGYPPAGYPAAPPPPPLPTGTLDSFYDQPSGGGGPSFKFMDANRNPLIGKSYVGIVARPVTNADIRAQTDDAGRVQTFKDGRPKFVMVVPMQVPASEEFTDGVAGWWVKGQARDELARAMAEAGAPVGPPEPGAAIRVTLVNTRPVPGKNPAFVFRVEYMRPQGAAPVDPRVAVGEVYNGPPAPVQPAPQAAQVQQPMPPMAPPPVQAAPVPMPQPAPAQTAPAPSAVPPGLSEDQAALFAKLTGG